MYFPIYLYIAVLLLAGLLSTRLMKKLKLPNVTGYILTGIIMGPFLFGLFFNNFSYEGIKDGIIFQYIQQISWVSSVALGFIAFSIGTSFKASLLKSVGKRVLIITVLEALEASLLVILALMIAHFIVPDTVPWSLVLTLGAIASATAPAATLMVIKQYNAKGNFVNTLLPVVALDDAVALILFAILFQMAKGLSLGQEVSAYLTIGKPLIEIALSLGIGAVIGVIVTFLNRFFQSRNNRLVLCIVTVFASIGLYKLFQLEQLGGFELSSLLMCMVSGAIYTNFAKEYNNKTLDLLDRFTSPIYMVFFIISGASLDLTIFASDAVLTVVIVASLYLVSRVVGKWLGAFSGAVISKAEPNVRKYLGFALIPQAGVAIGLATNASALFSANPATAKVGALIIAIVLTSTLIYELIGPFVSKWALTKAGAITVTPPNEDTPKAKG